MSKTVKTIIIVVLVAVLGIAAYFVITSQLNAQRVRTYDQFVAYVEDNRADKDGDAGSIPDDQQIRKIVISGYNLYGYTDVNSNTYTYSAVGPSLYGDTSEDSTLQRWMDLGIQMVFAAEDLRVQQFYHVSNGHGFFRLS